MDEMAGGRDSGSECLLPRWQFQFQFQLNRWCFFNFYQDDNFNFKYHFISIVGVFSTFTNVTIWTQLVGLFNIIKLQSYWDFKTSSLKFFCSNTTGNGFTTQRTLCYDGLPCNVNMTMRPIFLFNWNSLEWDFKFSLHFRIGMVARLLQLGGCMRLGRRRGERKDGVGKGDEKMRRGVRHSNQWWKSRIWYWKF